MKLILLRHGQSSNTEIASIVLRDDYRAGTDDAVQREMEKCWLQHRQPDPGLTAQGQSEAATLAQGLKREYLAAVMDLEEETEISNVLEYRVLSSPMRRALETALPLADALGLRTVVAEADLCEVGGYYGAPGEPAAPSPSYIASAYGSAVDVSRLSGGSTSTGWWSDNDAEGLTEATSRAQRTAKKLISMAQGGDGGPDVVVVVSHDAYLQLLVSALLDCDARDDEDDLSTMPRAPLIPFSLMNTGTVAFDISTLDGEVTLLWLNRIDHFFVSAL